MPRPSYCPDPPTGRKARNFYAPSATHHPRIRDLAIDYAVRYGRLDRTVLMEACAEPERFMALYEATDDPTVHRAIYCVELGNRPQFMLAIEDEIEDLLHSAKALPFAGEGRVWYPHMRDPKYAIEGQSAWREVSHWEGCTPERLKELPPVHPELVRESDVLNWRDVYVCDDGLYRIVGFEVACKHRTEASLLVSTLGFYLWGGSSVLPLHQAVLELPKVESVAPSSLTT
jgi:hypothetical protein